ncbi:MAG: hypothetical protein ABEK10_01260 [Candidatus Nanosalina sp.]
MENILERLNRIHRDGETPDPLQIPDNWDAATLVEYILDRDLEKEGFSSRQDIIGFTLGIGEYSDRNSFVYGPADVQEMKGEGYFSEPYCNICLQEATQAEIDEDIDPFLEPELREYTRKSFKNNADRKKVRELLYQCESHPEVYIGRKEKEHF